MSTTGAGCIALGIIVLVAGITAGVLMIVSGGTLLKEEVTFCYNKTGGFRKICGACLLRGEN